ncbi:MAG TPA: hypothetical protein VMV45_13115 [Casimicrobiaceae bacterium]|nr:hypothetical protein [Casimicrobiaceae bacterium]
MKTRRTFVALAFASAAIAAPMAVYAADFDVQLNVAPPPPRHEVIPASPGEGYVWAPGYWNWEGGQYRWQPGHYMQGHRGERWVGDRWEEREGRWSLNRGHWDRDEEHHGDDRRDEHRERDRD